MSTIDVPSEVKQLIELELASGEYQSESDVMLKALQVLAERRETIAGIQAGLDDFDAGRSSSLEEFEERIRAKFGFGNDSESDVA